MNLLMSLLVTMSFMLTMLNHPLSMGFILILQTLISSLIIGYMMKSFLFSYIIIIIMLSGALVLFIYMASVASNEKFKFTNKLLYPIILFMMFMLYMNFHIYSMKWMNNYLHYNEFISLIKTFNTNSSQMTIMMIIYIFLVMIVVSNIAKTNDGPLRTKN
uniref:NADH dehydrogenase subunit 6 n=1 Tax=Hippotiscus dorsalis TaxID=2880909 RepID=UPI001D121576|nr:NADH dehydrogenase subunit 6 [Hippotiscus dorsalis]UCC46023.1 NADH dehydrogenase subunit 6 [Hippotiscus dorsalis]